MQINYIFTVTNGRSGQATLFKVLQEYSNNCLSEFEAPNINPFFPWLIGDLEKKFRRRYVETNELLGRGKVIEAYEEKNYEYIERVSRKRLFKINKQLNKKKANCYFDISKFYIRGLYKGFNKVLNNFSLLFLVRDPLENMKSFLNRKKNFFLDNSSPSAQSNILKLDIRELSKGELYLWSWAETFLRFQKLSTSNKINKSIIFKTEDLHYPKKIEDLLKSLDISYNHIKKVYKVNTNVNVGLKKTEVSNKDIFALKKFILKVPKEHKDVIKQLELCLNKQERLLV